MVEAAMQITKPQEPDTEIDITNTSASPPQASAGMLKDADVEKQGLKHTTENAKICTETKDHGIDITPMTFKTKLIYYAFMAVGIMAWMIGIGGLSASTRTCNVVKEDIFGCSSHIRLIWMSFWFFLVMNVVTIALSFLGRVPYIRHLLLTLWSMCTICTILSADYALTLQSIAISAAGSVGPSLYETAAVTYSGAILMSIIGFVIVLGVGGLDRTSICH